MSLLRSSAARCAVVLSLLAVGCSQPSEVATNNDAVDSDLTISELPIRMTGITSGTIDSLVDHAPENAALGTFKQRYWYSTQFADGPDAPVIFNFCGEAACSGGYLTAFADVAKVLHASVVTLEHRYYGESLPFQAPSIDQMKYLTIHNALEDTAAFEAFAKDKLKLNGKWIAVGGSYPGMLAAFYRQQHPELVVGAWASSAPVLMQESFFGYDQVAARALGTECDALFRKALTVVDESYEDETKWAALTLRVFGRPVTIPQGLDPATTKYVKSQYMQWVSGQAMTAAQFGNTHNLCSALAQFPDSPLDGLIGFANPPLVDEATDAVGAPPGPGGAGHPLLGPGGDATSFDEAAVPVSSSLPPAGQDTPYRGETWSYQECSEVGFFKVFNPNREESIMTESQDVEVARLRCQGIAGRLPNIEQTRATYLDPILRGEVTNLYFVNGSLDPWSSLSFTDRMTAPSGVTTHVVALGSHCTDLRNLDRNAALGVFQAHKQFHDLAVGWLAN